jgi:hydroxymethylpyrimidine kinase/phosphomethylpyrimidine kinase/thiamine-phosphate diphosphorylase
MIIANQFPDCGPEPLGLYPVLDSLAWLKKLFPLGVRTFQLRIKNKTGQALEDEIQESINLAKQYRVKLFINDYWELAIRYRAYGVHLGQADLNTADVNMIRQAGLRLGISTHCDDEITRARAFKPSYLACGPVFTTTSKVMPFTPIGVTQLKQWRQALSYPLVAIGGINVENLVEVIQTKVDGIAMISAITQAQDPIAVTKKMLTMVNQYVAYTR